MSGVRVVILGAGLAGMTVAYQLGKVGYDCRVLEARPRPGGRVFTVRRGTVSEEDGPSQTAAFDDGLYLNAGPMRIPYHHQTTLAYCRELQVPTEVFVPDCESAYLYQTRGPLAGRRIRLREARADFDGHIAELLSKALSQTQLDQPLTAEDRERVLAYLRRLGALDAQRPVPRLIPPRPRRPGPSVLAARAQRLFGGIPEFYVQTDWFSQPTMMQVAGGMDRLPAALAARLGNRIIYRAPVAEIRQSERGAWVIYADAKGRRSAWTRTTVSPRSRCRCCAISRRISRHQCSRPLRRRVYDSAGRIGLQFRRRFWEQDDEIYGGRSWTDQEIGQILYPSHGFGGPKASCRLLPGFRRTMVKRPPAELQRMALEQGARIHPQYPTEFESAFSVTWPRVPWNRGSGGRNRPRRMKRSRRCGSPTAGCTSRATT